MRERERENCTGCGQMEKIGAENNFSVQTNQF